MSLFNKQTYEEFYWNALGKDNVDDVQKLFTDDADNAAYFAQSPAKDFDMDITG